MALASLALVATAVVFAAPAQAVSWYCFKDHYSLSIGGKTASADMYFKRDFDNPVMRITRIKYNTSPAFKADRVTFATRANPGVDWIVRIVKGGESSSTNDVAENSDINYDVVTPVWGESRMSVWDAPNGSKADETPARTNLGAC